MRIILLARFLSCFTLIMTTCEDSIETAGRSLLLHAVSTVLECLPLAEARSFHNLVMVKIEQGRIGWDTDFTILASNFMERKVRQSMRAKAAQAGASASQRRNFRGCSRGYNNSNSNYNGNNSNSNSPFNNVCRQWNLLILDQV